MSRDFTPAPCPIPLAPLPWDEMRVEGDGYRPGDWRRFQHEGSCTWENCDGWHLWVVLPCGCLFDANARAGNCTMPNDRTHRCWVMHGTVPDITLDKAGHTCQAGAGSIGHVHWHGYIRAGQLVT